MKLRCRGRGGGDGGGLSPRGNLALRSLYVRRGGIFNERAAKFGVGENSKDIGGHYMHVTCTCMHVCTFFFVRWTLTLRTLYVRRGGIFNERA